MAILIFNCKSLIIVLTKANTLKIKPSAILLPVAALVGLSLYAQQRASGFLNYYISSIALAFDGMTPILRLNIAIQNPSNQQFVVRSMVGTVLANDTPIGNISSFQTVVINPNSQQILPVYIRLKVLSIVTDIITLIQNGSGISQTITVTGNVNANNIVAPVNLSYKII